MDPPRRPAESVVEEIEADALFEIEEAAESMAMLSAADLELVDPRRSAAETVDAAVASIPASAPAIAPEFTPAPIPEQAAVAAATAPVATYDEAPSVGPLPSAARSESAWSVSASVVDDIAFTSRRSWWRYTLVSAGITAVLCSLGFVRAGDGEADAVATEPAPTVVAFDAGALAASDETDAAPAVAPVRRDGLLARRIALRGARNFDAGRVRLAKSAFEEALRHDAECRPALAGLGRIHFAAGRHKAAIDMLAPALRIEPRDAELQRMLADAYRAIGHAKSAARHEKLAARYDDTRAWNARH